MSGSFELGCVEEGTRSGLIVRGQEEFLLQLSIISFDVQFTI